MGQAKKRGTFEQRQAEAVELERQQRKLRAELNRRRGKSMLPQIIALALAAGYRRGE